MERSYMTTGDAAKLAQISNQAVLVAAEQGRLPVAFRTVGGFRLFRREDVERFAALRQRRTPGGERRRSGGRAKLKPRPQQDVFISEGR